MAYDAAIQASIELSIYPKNLPKLGIKRDSLLGRWVSNNDEVVMMFNKAVDASIEQSNLMRPLSTTIMPSD